MGWRSGWRHTNCELDLGGSRCCGRKGTAGIPGRLMPASPPSRTGQCRPQHRVSSSRRRSEGELKEVEIVWLSVSQYACSSQQAPACTLCRVGNDSGQSGLWSVLAGSWTTTGNEFRPAVPARSEELTPPAVQNSRRSTSRALANQNAQFVSPLSRNFQAPVAFKSSACCRASSFFDLFFSLLYYGHLL